MSRSNIDDVQEFLIRTHNYQHIHYYLLRIRSVSATKQFLQTISSSTSKVRISDIQSSRATGSKPVQRDGKFSVQIGFSSNGLLKLANSGKLESLLRVKTKAFYAGARDRSVEFVGDSKLNHPVHWETPYADERVDIVLSIHSNTTKLQTQISKSLRSLPGASGLVGWDSPEKGAHRDENRHDRREHFNFRDGISQPVFHRSQIKPEQSLISHQKSMMGEFLLGHRNNRGQNPFGDIDDEALKKLFHNGSFAAFRKIEQDVGRFFSNVDRIAEDYNAIHGSGADKKIDSSLVSAKLVGRWPNGAPIEPEQISQPANMPSQLNQFDFGQDQEGAGCPVTSHIRRCNPRGDEVILNQKPMLLRRGIPYGSKYKPDVNENEKRGLLGLFLCASLEDQFELIMRQWINNAPPKSGSGSTSFDPLIGSGESTQAVTKIPLTNRAELSFESLEGFTSAKGMVYLFYPSTSALDQLATQLS